MDDTSKNKTGYYWATQKWWATPPGNSFQALHVKKKEEKKSWRGMPSLVCCSWENLASGYRRVCPAIPHWLGGSSSSGMCHEHKEFLAVWNDCCLSSSLPPVPFLMALLFKVTAVISYVAAWCCCLIYHTISVSLSLRSGNIVFNKTCCF